MRSLLLAGAAGLAAATLGARDAQATCTPILDTTICDGIGGAYAGIAPQTPLLIIDGTVNGPVQVDDPGVSMLPGGADASITTLGTVTVTSGGTGISLQASGGFAGTVTLSAGTQVTADADGVFIQADAGAATLTMNGGSITTTGSATFAAAAVSIDGPALVTLAAGAAIGTQAADGYGAVAFSLSAGATIQSGGNITTLGDDAIGLAAMAGTTAAITITGGSITTGDTGFGTGARAHGAQASGDTAGILMTGGSVQTTGSDAHGLNAVSDSGAATITTSGGTIQTAGSGAYGLLAVSVTGPATVIAGGSIITTGPFAYGAQAMSQFGGAASVLVTGSIITTEAQSHGAMAVVNAGAGNALVENAGIVVTGGDQAAALYATVGLGPGSATVRNSGSAATGGSFSPVILAVTNAGGVEVTNTGSLTATGPQGDGIAADTAGAVRITSSGGVAAGGAAASGIHIYNAAGGYTIVIGGGSVGGGSTDALLGNAAGILIEAGAAPGGSIAIGAGATVTALSGVAIRNDADGALLLSSGGSILGDIVSAGGNDQVTLEAGSVTQGQVLLGAGDDLAAIGAGADIAGVTLLDGGAGTDTLRFRGASVTGGAQFVNWEVLNLVQGARLSLDADLVMGGSDTLTGSVAIDPTSTLAAPGNRIIRAFDAASLVTVTNAGSIAIGNSATAGSTLTIIGNYVGQGGSISLNTVLAGDGSASDRLVIDRGRASGDTALRITNLGGAGAATVQGIRVVETRNGGTTDAGAFRLATRVTAGAFEYQLFRGGSGSAQDWYLRSFLIPVPPPEDPGTPETPTTPETPNTPETPTTPAAPGPAIPLYRPEAALYAPVPAIGRQMGLAALGTLEARRGGEIQSGAALGKEDGAPGFGAWARVIGERSRSRWDGTVNARATANLIGMQAGFDVLLTAPYGGGHRDILGVYVAYTDYNAPDVSGFALGQQQRVGRLLLSGPSVGAYWTHLGPGGWYLDAVAQVSWFDVSARSVLGAGLGTSGTGYAASLAAGYPVRFGGNWQVEPQAQLIWQGVSVDRAHDRDAAGVLSAVDWDEDGAVTGRIGARLQYTGHDGRTLWQPYAKLNLWHAFSGRDRIGFGSGAPIENRFGGTALEVGAGISARIGEATSLYAHADYRWSVAGDSRQSVTQGSIGIRVAW